MQINEIMERILLIDIGTYASIVALVLAITKGITEFFNITNRNTKLGITIGITSFLSLMIFVVPTIEQQGITSMVVLQMVSTIILIFFGASGIYQFIPSGAIKDDEYIVDDEVIEIDIEDENLDKELGN